MAWNTDVGTGDNVSSSDHNAFVGVVEKISGSYYNHSGNKDIHYPSSNLTNWLDNVYQASGTGGFTPHVYPESEDISPDASNKVYFSGQNLTVYSGQNSQIVISGGTTNVDVGEKFFYAYDSAGEIDINSGWTDITLDTEKRKDNCFTHSVDSAEVTIDEDRMYEITYYVTTHISTGTGRSDSEGRLLLDTGSGYAEVGGTRGGMYNRTAGEDLSNANATTLLSLNVGDKVKVQAQRNSGSDTVVTYADSCGLLITKKVLQTTIEDNLKGAKGDDGAPGANGDVIWSGSWFAGTYAENAAVQHNGSSYVANTSTSDEPPSIDWDLMAASGAKGEKGDVGTAPALGHFIINSTGNYTEAIGFTPSRIKFEATPPVDSADVDQGDQNNQDITANFAGYMIGYAISSTNTEQMSMAGGAGNSINSVKAYASSNHCIGVRYADQNAQTVGDIHASMNSWNSDGFTVGCYDYTGIDSPTDGLLVIYTAWQ